MARVTLSQAGEDVIVGGSDIQVIGTSAGGEVITVISGNIRLDPSFNQGGDTIVLPGNAEDYTAYRSGGEVIFTSASTGVTLRIPVGANGTEIDFGQGDSRTLLFNGTAATLEGQVIGTSSIAQTPLNPSGPPPLVNYDVVGANATVAEGDSGSRLLVFTISLDRPVTAADGPVTLNYQTQNGTADSATDYVAAAGTVTFAVGQQVATVSVVVNGDVVPEASELLTLLLTGANLRNGPETLTGTITNDDVSVSLTGAADNFQGSANNDGFFAANNGLGAGDKITDGSNTDNDTFSLAVDGNVGSRNFGGFALTNIENVEVTNDSGLPVTLDMSSSTGVKSVASVNSSDTVIFNELTSNAKVIVDNVTGANANVEAVYQAAVTAGATTVNVEVNDTTANRIILGTVGAGNTGIETVNLTVSGTSTINRLATQLTTLNINGGGDVTLVDQLVNSVRTVDASTAGRVTVDFSNNDGAGTGVTFTGSNGNDIVRSGAAADNVSTGAGSDTVTDEGGNDTINTGTGADTVTLLGSGDVNIDTGADGDSVSFAPGQFNGNDKVAFGDGADTLVLAQSTVETDYTVVSSAETLTVATNATTNLGSNGGGSLAQDAGIRTVNLNLNGLGVEGPGANDTLTAIDYTVGLTVNLGGVAGTDTVLLGSGDDTINTSSFDGSDNLQGNLGVDTVNITDGTINSFLSIGGIEVLNFVSDGDGQDQAIGLTDANAPSAGNVVTVNAGTFASDETFFYNGLNVTAYSVNITTGAGVDTIFTDNGRADVVTTNGGADNLFLGGGDTANAGAGADTVNVNAGDNIVNAGDGNDVVALVGAGNSTLNGDAGDDRFDITASALLTAGDTINGGADTDTIRATTGANYVDAQFTGVTSVEVLESNGATANFTIGTEAQEGGIRTVRLTDAAGADTLVASDYTAGLTVFSAGGNDVITTGSGADIINLAGAGSVVVTTNDGDDSIRVSGTAALDASDKIAGGNGADVIELDNTGGTVIGTADLANVTGIDTYRILAGGDLGAGVDANANSLTFTSSAADVVTSVTPITVDASALTDGDDSFTLVIGPAVADSDFSFIINGSSTATTVDKQNVGINNNIDFRGGTGVDTLRIAGSDAGSTVLFNGGGGTDRIVQTGGSILTDDGFIGLSSVEVLGADTAINAVLGSRAAGAGIVRVDGTANNDLLTVGAGYTGSLLVNLGAGNDNVSALLSSASLTFAATAANFTAADLLVGGTGTGDVANVGAGGTADLTSTTKVETININNTVLGAEATVLNIDASALEVDGTMLTVNVNGSESVDTVTINGATVAENLTVNGGTGVDTINSGTGNDILNGNGGDDLVFAGSGNDTVNGGAGVDTVRGQLGNDIINGDDGNDNLYGDITFADAGSLVAYNAFGGGSDTINGGLGDDLIIGGLGKDTLTGGTGVDTFRYFSVEDSRFIQSAGAPLDARDVITDFVAGVDEIDLTQLAVAAGQTIRFNGDFGTYAEAQAAVGSTALDGFLDVAFVRNLGGQSVLFVDVDNNGQLDGNDLQIIMTNVTGTLTAGDVNNPHMVTGPVIEGGVFNNVYGQGMGHDDQFAMLRSNGGFDSLHIA